MLNIENTQLVIIDIQGKLSTIMHEAETFLKNSKTVIESCKLMQIPITWVEQTPEKLGKTNSIIAELLTDYQPISKKSFSAWASEEVQKSVAFHNRQNVILIGIETHICVYQTATDLINSGYNVYVVSDAVSSRTSDNKALGIRMIEKEGGYITGTESIVFQLIKTSDYQHFREIAKMIR